MTHSQGASMVQVLVAAGLFAAVFLGTVNLMREQAKTSQSSSREFEMVYVTDEIKSLLSNPEVCRATLQGRNPHSDQLETLKRPLNENELLELYPTIQSDPEALYGQNNLKIMGYQISDEESEVDVEAGTTEFIITYATPEQTVINQKRRLRLYIGLNEEGLITSCQTTPGLSQTGPQEDSQQGLWTPSVAREGHYASTTLRLGLSEEQALKTEPMSAGLDQSSGILLLSEHGQRKCTKLLEGSLRFHAPSRQIQICTHEQAWKKVPTYNFNPLEAKFFSTSSQSKAPLDIGNRNFCTLMRADVSSGQCSLSQKLNNNWQLHAIGQNTKCQALCYEQVLRRAPGRGGPSNNSGRH